MIPCIYIVGAQCTGKTTLVGELKKTLGAMSQKLNFDEPYAISEVARKVLKSYDITREEIRNSSERSMILQKAILYAQLEAENDALRQSSWYISDRSGVDPIVYAKRYVDPDSVEALMLDTNWIKVIDRMKSSLVIVCEAGVTWLRDDGVRLMPEDQNDWVHFHSMFCETLDEVGLEYCVLPADIEDISERVGFVIAKWVRRIALPSSTSSGLSKRETVPEGI
ncbi:hypothetical protein jhhlp_002931 [Lomentospora prolificans]|uniref:NadR/Ttd14 AAA domain-containing protein n=1 Tax=Lomentospora prolificans TaxID=41688 RepID=A0A2N3NFF0_9PEZI|nr:hypothetical protein jhhlp_002931 [Lomentospora prolificans]